MKKMRHISRAAFIIPLLGLFMLVQGSVVVAGDGEDTTGSNPHIVFDETVPSSVFRTFTAPDEGADVDVFAQDCCIRDDIVEIYVDGCLFATVNSIDGDPGTHPGETHTVSVGPGTHTVEYRNVQSGVGPSGWEVSETLKPFTGNFRCGTCVVPDGGPPILEWISGYGTCGPGGKKNPTWGSFGRKPGGVLVADSGEKLEVECGEVGGGLLAFVLYYTPPGGDRLPLGMCPFVAGCNSGWFWHAGDNDNNNMPDCFVKTRWISRDYGDNDIPNLWTGEQQEDPALLDWADSLFSMNNDRLDKLDHKFNYLVGPPVPGGTCTAGGKPEGNWVRSMHVDPALWPGAGAFFALQNLGLETEPMEECPFAPCDLDKDGDCDEGDGQIFADAFGKCRGEPGYNFDADIDGDGCVVTNDEQVLLPPPPPPPRPVGGIIVPVNKLELLAPWIGLASLMAMAVAAVVFKKR